MLNAMAVMQAKRSCFRDRSPLVSIIVPCYKFAHLLPQCVNSVLRQTYQDYEILIMDNCSPDNTPEIARSFRDFRVRHIRNEENIGHIRNFNKGISVARGKYVWLLSADDSLRSAHVLERYVNLMERNPRVGYVFCRAIELRNNEEGAVVAWADCGNEDRIWNGHSFLGRLILSNCVVWSSSMVRKECYDKVATIPLDLPFAQDWYMWCVFALHYDVAYFAEPMVHLREHEASLTSSFNRGVDAVGIRDELNVLFRVRREMERIGLRLPDRIYKASIAYRASLALRSGGQSTRPGLGKSDFDDILRRNARDLADEEEIRARVYVNLGDGHYWDGAFDRAKRSYWVALRLHPWWLRTWTKYLLLQARRLGGVFRQAEGIIWHDARCRAEEREIRARDYVDLGDRQYWDSEFDKARRSYRKVLRLRPWWLGTWTKYLLLHAGRLGVGSRELVGLWRRRGIETDFTYLEKLHEKRTNGVQVMEFGRTEARVGCTATTKLLFITKAWGFGGTELHLLDLVKRLGGCGLEVLIVQTGADVYSNRMKGSWPVPGRVWSEELNNSFWAWFRFFRKIRPDIVVFVNGSVWTFPWYANIAAWLAEIRRVYFILHSMPYPTPERLIGRTITQLFGLRFATRFSCSMICASNAIRDTLVRDHGFRARKVRTIHNGVSIAAYQAFESARGGIRKRLEIGKEEFLLVCVARLDTNKGIDILLSALARVVAEGTPCKCVIVGDGPLEYLLMHQVQATGLSNHVFFEGFQSDVRPYLQAGDAFVLTSRLEGFPLAVLEAMACGLPCILTNVGGVAEAVTDGVHGLIVKAESVDEVADAISYLASHPRERTRMGKMASARVRDNFNIEDSMAEIKRVILS
jgi:glycosyltransferase involved in cell wall biosynthesis